MPEWCSANPPLSPSAINKYRDKNLVTGCGISRFDLSRPALTPKIKKRIAGSRKLFIFYFYEILVT
jgi:hypothetical protein